MGRRAVSLQTSTLARALPGLWLCAAAGRAQQRAVRSIRPCARRRQPDEPSAECQPSAALSCIFVHRDWLGTQGLRGWGGACRVIFRAGSI